MTRLPPLDPAVARTRLAVRRALAEVGAERTGGVVLVALSGGPDSLALAAATAFEARGAKWRAGAVIVDHGLQEGSDEIARAAAVQATALGLDPVSVRGIHVDLAGGDGPEAAARNARYAALDAVRAETGATWILTGHTIDDQAEQVLLAIARGSGIRSLAGIPPRREYLLRPFLTLDRAAEHAVDRATTAAACAAQGLIAWTDPHNHDTAYGRVRVRNRILPVMEQELGPEIARALARTAELAREDADALDAMAEQALAEIMTPASPNSGAEPDAGVSVPVEALAAHPPALRQRIIRRIADAEFRSHLTREHTLQIAALITGWRGQGPLDVPGISVHRNSGVIHFIARRAAEH